MAYLYVWLYVYVFDYLLFLFLFADRLHSYRSEEIQRCGRRTKRKAAAIYAD